MKILQKPTFAKAVKNLHKNQKIVLDTAISNLMENPTLGEEKKGDLSGVRVYKFHIHTQLYLLAYSYDMNQLTLVLLALGAHENFYRDLKRSSDIQ